MFSNMKTENWDLQNWLFNYVNEIALGLVERYFFEFGAYVSVKVATGGVWQCRFCWIWVEISQFLKWKKLRIGTYEIDCLITSMKLS